MFSKVDQDINRGYVWFIESISSSLSQRKNRGILSFRSLAMGIRIVIRICFIPILYLYGGLLLTFLKIHLSLTKSKKIPDLYTRAIKYIPDFISQYPMHLYPVVAKSMELAFLKIHLREEISRLNGGIAELAIGEGTFSSRIFTHEVKLVGFDLNPYSLIQVNRYPHVARRVVADCRRPPIASRGASLIVCNNFLHHVTEKEDTLRHWALAAPYAIFNENTNYWASGWLKPFVFRLLGSTETANQAAQKIESQSLQTLWKAERLKLSIRKFYEIKEEESFLSEKVFFLSAIFSALLFCYGPPTPPLQKKIMNRCFGPLTKFFTYQIAKSLIEYDSTLPRERDTFLSWFVRSKFAEENDIPNQVTLVCPDCRGLLQENRCFNCQKTYEERDGMLFLLPMELMEELSYSENQEEILGREHL